MFRIRKEQMDHFKAKGRRAYLERLVAFVRSEHPELLPLGSDPLERIRALVEKADAYGFSLELDTTQLVLLLLLFGDAADERLPWFREVLNDRNYMPIGKVRRLVELARERGEANVDKIDISAPEVVI